MSECVKEKEVEIDDRMQSHRRMKGAARSERRRGVREGGEREGGRERGGREREGERERMRERERGGREKENEGERESQLERPSLFLERLCLFQVSSHRRICPLMMTYLFPVFLYEREWEIDFDKSLKTHKLTSPACHGTKKVRKSLYFCG